MGLIKRPNETIEDVLNQLGIKVEDWNFYLSLGQYSYNTIPMSMFHEICSYEVLYGFLAPEFVGFIRKPVFPEHVFQNFGHFSPGEKNVAQAAFHMIQADLYKKQDYIWYQMKGGTRIAVEVLYARESLGSQSPCVMALH